MKKINTFLLMLLCVFVFTSCGSSTNKEKQWGSFTAEKTNSFNDVFYALQTVEEKDDASYIVVDVYKTEKIHLCRCDVDAIDLTITKIEENNGYYE